MSYTYFLFSIFWIFLSSLFHLPWIVDSHLIFRSICILSLIARKVWIVALKWSCWLEQLKYTYFFNMWFVRIFGLKSSIILSFHLSNCLSFTERFAIWMQYILRYLYPKVIRKNEKLNLSYKSCQIGYQNQKIQNCYFICLDIS